VIGVYPSLILTYLGQASWLMHNLDGYGAVFYNSLPKPVFWPIFVVSVLASIVSSQVRLRVEQNQSVTNQCYACM
jgi:KUP system potassium uptake protein